MLGFVAFLSIGLIPAHAGKTCGPGSRRARLGAHPRSRGENIVSTPCISERPGSSPLTRGKLATRTQRTCRVWLIPAHAGKTSSSTPPAPFWWAHPRSRGENLRAWPDVGTQMGSSPLTRGKLRVGVILSVIGGLIPAHAGKTNFPASMVIKLGAHPRSRGENVGRHRRAQWRWGSSPLTRGKPMQQLDLLSPVRLIPAHAGKTWKTTRTVPGSEAHPRSRGENAAGVIGTFVAGGSSPLTRGKHLACASGELFAGLIPAHAGKTRPWAGGRPWRRAHPRSRGENRRVSLRRPRVRGSSPLTRGKHSPHLHNKNRVRLIPAHAGKTSRSGVVALAAGAHPRSRGENAERGGGDQLLGGSSPLTRGKLNLETAAEETAGLIPAHAGKT